MKEAAARIRINKLLENADARSQNCRFVILSNGNLHYFWDLERGNPYVITAFPTPASITGCQKTTPNPKRLIQEVVGDDYVVLTQRPGYASEAAWKNEAERPRFIQVNGLRLLRLYQKKEGHLRAAPTNTSARTSVTSLTRRNSRTSPRIPSSPPKISKPCPRTTARSSLNT